VYRGDVTELFDGALDPPLSDREYVDDQRMALNILHDRLNASDTVHVTGSVSGVYALVAADVVGPERVTVDPGDGDDGPVRDILVSAGFDAVEVVTSPPMGTTVLVVDETRVGRDWPVPSAVRYLFVKSDDPDLESRLADAGYDTNRTHGVRPLGTPWDAIVEAVPDGRGRLRPWSHPDRPGYDSGDDATDETVERGTRIELAAADSVPTALKRAVVTAAYGLYRAPVVVARSPLVTVPLSVVVVVAALGWLLIRVRFAIESTGASETTVALGVLAATVVAILAVLPLIAVVSAGLHRLVTPSDEQ
jgi:hypothetical protein